FSVSGPGAESWLESLVANKLPQKVGRIGLCHMLSLNGGVRAEFTIYKQGPRDYYLVSAGAMERHDFDYLQKNLPDSGVQLACITSQKGVLVVAGPQARNLVQKLTDSDLSHNAFPWLTGQDISIGAAQATAMRVNFVGELGWELHHPVEMQNYIYDLLMDAGQEYDLKPFGIRAMDSLRIEKSYRLIPRELSIEYAALESGLDRFVKLDKGDFIGRDALKAWQDKGFANTFVTMEVHGITHTDPRGNEPIYHNGERVGRATSGNYGWRLGKSIALAMVPPALSDLGTEFEIEILAERYKATVIEESPFDPVNERLRS
ncbi:MAG: aminomethyltransferase family protein, partial [Fimbriimonadaceae bacterium]|nr:aminomethyltransferase family protein [Alphaproteobacteria bacterium]